MHLSSFQVQSTEKKEKKSQIEIQRGLHVEVHVAFTFRYLKAVSQSFAT